MELAATPRPAAQAKLQEISLAMSQVQNVDELLHLTADTLKDLVTCDRASVALISVHQPTFFHVFALSGNRALPTNQDFPLANTATEHCIKQAACTYFPNLEGSPWREHGILYKGGLRSTACAPLLVAGRVIGTLNVGSRSTHAFSELNRQYLTQMALMLAVHVDNLRSMEERRRQIASAERLQHFGHQIASLAHELKSPVSASLMEISALMDLSKEFHRSFSHPDITKEDLYDIIQDSLGHITRLNATMERTSNYLQTLVDKTSQLQDLRKEEFFLYDELEECLRFLPINQRVYKVHIQMQGVSREVKLEGDAAKFRQMATHILSNAVEAMQENAVGDHIKVYTRETERDIFLSFHDNGPGIPDAIRERIFEHLFTSRVQGTGLGLSLSRDIMQGLFHGALKIVDSAQGAHFEASFPKVCLKRETGPHKPYQPFEGSRMSTGD